MCTRSIRPNRRRDRTFFELISYLCPRFSRLVRNNRRPCANHGTGGNITKREGWESRCFKPSPSLGKERCLNACGSWLATFIADFERTILVPRNPPTGRSESSDCAMKPAGRCETRSTIGSTASKTKSAKKSPRIVRTSPIPRSNHIMKNRIFINIDSSLMRRHGFTLSPNPRLRRRPLRSGSSLHKTTYKCKCLVEKKSPSGRPARALFDRNAPIGLSNRSRPVDILVQGRLLFDGVPGANGDGALGGDGGAGGADAASPEGNAGSGGGGTDSGSP